MAGPEIAVASTKAYTTQLVILLLLSLYMGQLKETVSKELVHHMVEELKVLPKQIEKVLTENKHMEKSHSDLFKQKIFFIWDVPLIMLLPWKGH